MKGILYSQYKSVEAYLNKIYVEDKTSCVVATNETIVLHKEKLQMIYNKYKGTFEEMANLVKEFEAHKLAITKLLILHNKKSEQRRRKFIPILNQIEEKRKVG